MDPIEPAEHTLQFVLGNPGAAIRDLQGQPAHVRGLFQGNIDAGGLARVFDRVVDQVPDGRFQLVGVADDSR
jgi:hypothetical protein